MKGVELKNGWLGWISHGHVQIMDKICFEAIPCCFERGNKVLKPSYAAVKISHNVSKSHENGADETSTLIFVKFSVCGFETTWWDLCEVKFGGCLVGTLFAANGMWFQYFLFST
jgi:hypothetical protein